MAEKQSTKEEITKEEIDLTKAGEYVYGLGRRKTATARARIYFGCPKEMQGVAVVNGKTFQEYFPLSEQIAEVYKPLETVGINKKDLLISIKTNGGGKTAQADAIRLAVARILVAKDAGYKSILKPVGFLTRDPRIRERKKPGLRRARRASQWVKR